MATARDAATAATTTATKPDGLRHRAPGRVGALALARPLRHRLPAPASARPSSPRRWPPARRRRRRGRVQAGRHGPRRARGMTVPQIWLLAAAAGLTRSPRIARPAVSPRPPTRRHGPGPAALVAPRGPARRSSSPRASAGCWSAHSATIRDFAVDLGWPVVVAARPGWEPSTTRCSRSRRRARGPDVRAVVLTPWPAQPGSMPVQRRGRAPGRGRGGCAGRVGLDVAQLARRRDAAVRAPARGRARP